MKYCPRCKQVKPRSEFARHARRKDGLQTYCRACRREIDHRRYEREVGRDVQQRPPRKSELGRSAWLISLKAGRACADCGRTYPHQVMQWDHKPGFEKLGDISEDFWGRTREEVLAEIAKCDLVCTNCHTIRTFSRSSWGQKWLREIASDYDTEGAA